MRLESILRQHAIPVLNRTRMAYRSTVRGGIRPLAARVPSALTCHRLWTVDGCDPKPGQWTGVAEAGERKPRGEAASERHRLVATVLLCSVAPGPRKLGELRHLLATLLSIDSHRQLSGFQRAREISFTQR